MTLTTLLAVVLVVLMAGAVAAAWHADPSPAGARPTTYPTFLGH